MPQAGIVAVAALIAALLVWASARISTAYAVTCGVITSVWLAFTAALAVSGIASDFSRRPPVFVRLLVAALLVSLILSRTKRSARLIESVPAWALVAAQSLRIPVELVLFGLYRQGRVPVQMTFEGLNFDVVTGLAAIIVAWRLSRRWEPRLLLAWNVLGLILLTTIVVIANLSAPTPLRIFNSGPSSAVLATWPFIWLPVFIVPAALSGHLLVFRMLRREKFIRSR